MFLTKKSIVKLGDFGLAKLLINTREYAKTVIGTPYYLAPEIIENRPYNFKSDIWSLGVLLYEMVALKPPFNANSLNQLAMRILKGAFDPLPAHFSGGLKGLVSKVLVTNPQQRLGINDILSRIYV
jgi:NIMA (never in mitosis gene a)-related kinase